VIREELGWRTVHLPWKLPRGETVTLPIEARVPPSTPDAPPVRLVGAVSDATVAALVSLVRRIVLERFGLGYDFERIVHAIETLARPSDAVREHLKDQDTKMLYVPGLTSQPVWDVSAFPWLADLERAADAITAEFLAAREALMLERAQPHLLDAGRWDQFHVQLHGVELEATARLCPRTAEAIRALARHLPLGRCYVSCMTPGTVIRPHCGPHNARIRMHLGLVTPDGAELGVMQHRHRWRAGECFMFDDSFWHHAHNASDRERIVLIVDFVHPDLTPPERACVAPVLSLLDAAQRAFA
jgi:aspartyl/asparaginyl beta-hydroxylase (cupin superfamily)